MPKRQHLTNADRLRVRQLLPKYLERPVVPLQGRVQERTELWASGLTMKEIAAQEGVSVAAVSQSVTNLVYLVLEYAEEQES